MPQQIEACAQTQSTFDCRHGYLQSLPPREYLPLFWQESELALLQGTELVGKANEDRYRRHYINPHMHRACAEPC